MITIICSCSRTDNRLIGTWSVDNISFNFDEKKNTPAMIQQFGEQERQSTLSFKNDSIVDITLGKMNGDYRYTIDKNGIITVESNDKSLSDNVLGILSDEVIKSIVKTDIGEMTVTFVKQ